MYAPLSPITSSPHTPNPGPPPAHKKLEPNWWLELESTYLSRLAERMELYLKHGTEVLNKLPGSEPACIELMEMSLQFLAARYPQHFTLDNSTGVFHNKLLGMEFEVFRMCPLMVLLHNIPEDFAIMLRSEETGQYELRAGFVCSSLGWTLQEKIGKALREIHGPIPDYAEKMATAMDRFVPSPPLTRPARRLTPQASSPVSPAPRLYSAAPGALSIKPPSLCRQTTRTRSTVLPNPPT